MILCAPDSKNDSVSREQIDKDLGGMSINKDVDGVDLVSSFNGSTFFTSSNFEENLNLLLSSYDQVFFCSNNHKDNLGLIALKPFNPGVVILTRLRKTKKDILRKINSIHFISVLLHD